jgi:hypothetical protein
MVEKNQDSVFQTDKRIRLGIWGLGRGRMFYDSCRYLNIDVVAGCDYNPVMREHFIEHNPDAIATDDAEEFLKMDFDAVLLATYATDHAGDAVRCFEAGKHVLSEVTSFHSMAEGVRLVEAAEKSGLVYNLAENYPWSKANMHLADLWREGVFGEFQYAEYEYLHNCRELAYTYIDGKPVQPGWKVHYWRTWANFHYYNTHSLGPVMHITNLRPDRVVSLPCEIALPGFPPRESMLSMGTAAPSLITFENGGLMRNLMGATMRDGHEKRIWGTHGAASIHGEELELTLGGSAPLSVTPEWGKLGDLAEKTGHGGGDFWVLYQFANQILNGEPGFFDIYRSAVCTATGILAFRSAMENGAPYDIPDFRSKEDRDLWRNDDFAQERFPVDGCFPEQHRDKAARFSTIALELLRNAGKCQAASGWIKHYQTLVSKTDALAVFDNYLNDLDDIRANYEEARALATSTEGTRGAEILQELIGYGDLENTVADAFKERVQSARNACNAE